MSTAALRGGAVASCGCLQPEMMRKRHASRRRELQDLGYGIHLVPLTRGKFALIDSAFAEVVGLHNWCAAKMGRAWYAYRTVVADDGRHVSVALHTQIAGEIPGLRVDHIDGDGLDNRRCNLRHVTAAQNAWNSDAPKTNKSGRKGVHFYKKKRKYIASIKVNGKAYHLGSYDDFQDAVNARAAAERALHGEFARAK